MKSMRAISLEEYIDYLRSGQQGDLTISCLNQIVSMHGFRKLSQGKALKKTLIDALKTIDLIEPSRSTLKDSVSSHAFLELKDVIADLDALNWHECTTTSIKTLCKEDPPPSKDSVQSPPRALKWKAKRNRKGKGKENSRDGIGLPPGGMIGTCSGDKTANKKKRKRNSLLKLITANTTIKDDDVSTIKDDSVSG